MAYHEFLQVLPLVSAAVWFGIGALPVLRRRLSSPFEGSLTGFALLLGLWAFLDWIFLGFADPSQADLAVLISNVRITVITGAMATLLFASKWIYLGHSRWDALLLVPVAGSLAIVWTGLTSGAEFVWWGPRLVRDPVRYSLWAAQQVAYLGAAIVMIAALSRQRRDIPQTSRLRIFWTGGSLGAFLVIWLATNIYNNVTGSSNVPWLSSLLVVPGVIILIALGPLSSEAFGTLFRQAADLERRVIAVYLFHQSGEPLVALASSRTFPIEPERMQSILSVVGSFVETSLASGSAYGVTALRFDAQGAVAVRGRHVIAAALYDGPAYDAVRSELVRIVRGFEAANVRELETWEGATTVAEAAADELSRLLSRADSPAP